MSAAELPIGDGAPAPVVLVVEDEAQIARFIELALESEGCAVHVADRARRGMIDAGTRRPDLIVLDLGLPDADGKALIREVRSWSEVPILVLSARTGEAEKIAALDAGADDYLTKPFGAGELLARVRAQLRRGHRRPAGGDEALEFGNLRVELARRRVWRKGEAVHLTPIEFRLLAYFVTHPESVLTHRQILKSVWGPSAVDNPHYVRIYLGNVRRKLEDDPARPKHFLTESGVGYRFSL